MIRSTFLLLTILQLNSCRSQVSDSERMTAGAKDSITVNVKLPLDSLWNQLVFECGGCLTGGQHVKEGRLGNEGCVMTDIHSNGKLWKDLFRTPKKELTEFLISQFADTATTRIHTCPCMPARNGEVAVYALQNIYKKNWYELDGFTKYGKKQGNGCTDNEQAWLWEILVDEKKRVKLEKEWLKELM